VAVILGEQGFEYLPEKHGLPGAIAGFEAEDILLAVYKILKRIEEKQPGVDNCYKRAVSPEGNVLAQQMVDKCFQPRRDIWRGLGGIDASGLGLREELSRFDAEKRFGIVYSQVETPTGCRCGDVICGRISPQACPMYGKVCTPEDPVGPCMVSSEGACAAAMKYAGI
jgi:hydrogenase expression/formation protein HypD